MPALVQSTTQVPQEQVESVLHALRSRSLAARRLRDWIIIEFTDGSDTFFARIVATSEAATSIEIASAIEKEFRHIDNIRSAVLTGLRWFLVEHEIAVEISPSGNWPIQQGNATSSLTVGPRLTRIAQQSTNAAEALLKLRQNQWLPDLTAERAAELTLKTAPPAREVAWKSDEEIVPLLKPTVLAIDCKNFENADPPTSGSSNEFLDWLAPTRNSPAQRVVNKFAEAIGLRRFSFELNGMAGFDFSDKLDSFPLNPRSKRLARLIEKFGEEQAFATLIDRFQALDQCRSRALALIEHIMAAHGFDLEEDRYHFGTTHRQYTFPSGRTLTAKLHKSTPEQIIFDWLSRNAPFQPLPTVAQIQSLPANQHLTRATRRNLPPLNPKTLPAFPDLAHYSMADVSNIAAEIIENAKAKFLRAAACDRVIEYEVNLRFWSRPLYYTRPRDAWVDEAYWIQLAAKYWNESRHPLAGVILVLNGDPSPIAQLLEPLKTAEYYNSELTWDEVWWLLVDQVPCPIDDYEEYPQFSKSMGPLPPQLGRFWASRVRTDLAKGDSYAASAVEWATRLDRTSLIEWLSPDELLMLREACRAWSVSADHPELSNDCCLNLAAIMGWGEILRNVEQNPEFIFARLNWLVEMGEDRSFTGELALILSQFGASPLALRFAAFTLTRKTQKEITLDRFQAAIAWLRCARSGDDLGSSKVI